MVHQNEKTGSKYKDVSIDNLIEKVYGRNFEENNLRYESLNKLNSINTYEVLEVGRFKSVQNRLRNIFKKENTAKSKYEIIDDVYSNDYIKFKLSSFYDRAIVAKSYNENLNKLESYDSPIIKFRDSILTESKNDQLFLVKNSNKISSQVFDSSKQVYYENAKCVAEFKYDIL